MYASLSFQTSPGPALESDVRDAMFLALGAGDREEILPGTWVVFVESTGAYVKIFEALELVGDQFPGQLRLVLFLHHRNQAYRTNAPHDKAAVVDIITR